MSDGQWMKDALGGSSPHDPRLRKNHPAVLLRAKERFLRKPRLSTSSGEKTSSGENGATANPGESAKKLSITSVVSSRVTVQTAYRSDPPDSSAAAVDRSNSACNRALTVGSSGLIRYFTSGL